MSAEIVIRCGEFPEKPSQTPDSKKPLGTGQLNPTSLEDLEKEFRINPDIKPGGIKR